MRNLIKTKSESERLGSIPKLLLMLPGALLIVTSLTGCFENTNNQALLLPEPSMINEKSFDRPTAVSVNNSVGSVDLNHKRLEATHAKLAAEHSDICPKLIVREIDRNSVFREGEVLTSDHCDYFIYPKVGEFISVETENDDLELLLITPKLHDFANGSYRVRTQDKYVIRAVYDGIERRPDDLNYDIRVIVN